jgi:hypothetical protein
LKRELPIGASEQFVETVEAEHSFLTEKPRYLNLGSSAKESVLSDKHGGAHREK